MNNPNLEILENRLSLWDKADDCAVFESGMSAISTVLLEFLKPGDLLVIMTFINLNPEEATVWEPRLVLVGKDNNTFNLIKSPQ